MSSQESNHAPEADALSHATALADAAREWRRAQREITALRHDAKCTEAEGPEFDSAGMTFPGVPTCDYVGPGYPETPTDRRAEEWCQGCLNRHARMELVKSAQQRKRRAARLIARLVDREDGT